MGMDHPEYVQSSIESLGSLLPSVSKQALHRKDSTDVCEREVRFGEQFFLAWNLKYVMGNFLVFYIIYSAITIFNV